MESEPFDFNTPINESITLLAKWDCPEDGHTIQDLLDALQDGTAKTTFPVNSQIDDYTNGSYDPWLVGHYGAQYGSPNTTGVYLYRKYVHPVNKAWGTGSSYAESDINSYLNGEYFNSCSDAIKNAVAQIDLPLVTGTTPAKMFLMSGAEVMAMSQSYAGGVAWDGWKERTGLTSSSTQPNAGRVMAKGEIANGSGDPWRLRTEMSNSEGQANVEFDGAVRIISSTTTSGIVPACFVPKVEASGAISDFKKALNDGNAESTYPVGTEIPDTYNGKSNPLIVAQYLNSRNNTRYDNKEGALLIRKYVDPVSQVFDSDANTDGDYIDSQIRTFLNDTYYNNCSEDLKKNIVPLIIEYDNSTVWQNYWFLMSVTELNNTSVTPEGIPLAYWKEKLAAGENRSMTDANGTPTPFWLRTKFVAAGSDQKNAYTISSTGLYTPHLVDTPNIGVLPACFVMKEA